MTEGRKLKYLTVGIIAVVVILLVLSGCQNSGDSNSNQNGSGDTDMLYEAYPDTSDAPVLEFLWGPSELQPEQVSRVSPYGTWEGEGGVYAHEPATEIEVVTTSTDNPVYAPCKGMITSLVQGNDGVGKIAIRYGTDYVILQHHVVGIPDSITAGVKVEQGDLLGYTETLSGQDLGFWELELYVKRDNTFRTQSPYEYFSTESQTRLDSFMAASGYSEWKDDTTERDWNITTGECWTKELDQPEWWGDSYLTGYQISDTESLNEFLAANDLAWVFN